MAEEESSCLSAPAVVTGEAILRGTLGRVMKPTRGVLRVRCTGQAESLGAHSCSPTLCAGNCAKTGSLCPGADR